MFTSLITLAALGLQATSPVPSDSGQEDVKLSIPAQAGLRCSAAFALVSYGQENGNEASLQWPTIDPKGREYFVQTIARIMDETGIDRNQAASLVEAEAERLLDANEIDSVMPSCLALLDSTQS